MISTWIENEDANHQTRHDKEKSDEHGPHKLNLSSFSLNVQL